LLPLSWTGFYIGVSGGGAWGRSRHTNSAGDLTPTFNVSGGIIGGTVGYNYQVNNWVLGLRRLVMGQQSAARPSIFRVQHRIYQRAP